MTVDDMEEMGAQMAASLAKSDAMKSRQPDSPMWVITIQKVQNLSSDVMTDGEQWGVMARLQSSLPIRALWDDKNIRMVVPAERLGSLGKQTRAEFNQPVVRRQPTHVMNATFRSATRADSKNRTESYFCLFEIIDLKTAVPVWIDKFEYKRAAIGHIWD
jgi:hypothetical protein